MRRQRTFAAALALAVLAVLPAAAEAQQQSAMRGTFTLNRQASDDIRARVNEAVARMSFVTRPIARGRLVRTNAAYNRVIINQADNQFSIQFDDRAAIRTPANGSPIKWTREDGEVLDVSTEWENGTLEQTFRAEDGQRVNVYSLSADGSTLTMNVTVTSPRLPQPLTYKLVFNRA